MPGIWQACGSKSCPRVPSDIHSESAGSCSLAEYKTGNPFNYLWSRRWGMCVCAWIRRRAWRKNRVPGSELSLSGPFSSACHYPAPSLFVWPSSILLRCPSLQPFLLFFTIFHLWFSPSSIVFLALSFLALSFSLLLTIRVSVFQAPPSVQSCPVCHFFFYHNLFHIPIWKQILRKFSFHHKLTGACAD